jgi:hypothetical protein
MIKEGVEIDRLHVFKKGPFERYVRMAKQQGVRGEPFWGIVRGDGVDIRFELSRADGFTSPPGPKIKLKEFLKEAAGLKFEPDYVIVDAAVFEEEDQQAGGGGKAPPAAAAGAEDKGEKFIRLLKLILPHVKRALATSTSLSDELQKYVREAQDLGRQRDFDNGMVALRRVGELAKQALAEAESVRATGGDEPVRDPRAQRLQEAEARRRRQWQERIAQVEPRYHEAIGAATPDARQMRLVMDYAQRQAGRKHFVKALVGLDRLEQLLGAS